MSILSHIVTTFYHALSHFGSFYARLTTLAGITPAYFQETNHHGGAVRCSRFETHRLCPRMLSVHMPVWLRASIRTIRTTACRARTSALLTNTNRSFDVVTPLKSGGWPRDNVVGDGRSHLSFWGYSVRYARCFQTEWVLSSKNCVLLDRTPVSIFLSLIIHSFYFMTTTKGRQRGPRRVLLMVLFGIRWRLEQRIHICVRHTSKTTASKHSRFCLCRCSFEHRRKRCLLEQSMQGRAERRRFLDVGYGRDERLLFAGEGCFHVQDVV
jgi:hypothetical protein